MATITEPLSDKIMLQIGLIRIISTKRKRKLAKRGDQCKWSTELNEWVWFPVKIGPISKLNTTSLIPMDVLEIQKRVDEKAMWESWKDPVIYASQNSLL